MKSDSFDIFYFKCTRINISYPNNGAAGMKKYLLNLIITATMLCSTCGFPNASNEIVIKKRFTEYYATAGADAQQVIQLKTATGKIFNATVRTKDLESLNKGDAMGLLSQ